MAKPLTIILCSVSVICLLSYYVPRKSVKINMGKPYSLISLLFHCMHMIGSIAELLQSCITPRVFAYLEWKKFTQLLKIINTRLGYSLL